VYWERITNANIFSGVLGSVGSTSSTRIVILDNTIGSILPSAKITCLVYKHMSCNGVIKVTGAANAEVMFTTNVINIGTGGFCIGERIGVGAPVAGNVSLTSLGEDYRLAVRISSHETLYTTGTLFDVVNLYVKADETRQMVVEPSPNRVGDIQNYIKVVI
jgi:hypothetical protein